MRDQWIGVAIFLIASIVAYVAEWTGAAFVLFALAVLGFWAIRTNKAHEYLIQRCGGDEALAKRIIEAERLRLAKARVALYRVEGRHMCLKLGCKEPVRGVVFGHCSKHLDFEEKRWWEEILQQGSEDKFIERITSIENVSDFLDAVFVQTSTSIRSEKVRCNITQKKEALMLAEQMIERSELEALERQTFLPPILRVRLDKAAELAQKSVRWNVAEDE